MVAGSSKNKLGGDDRFPTKRIFKKWEAKQQEERQQCSGSDSGEDDDVRVDGVGRRGGKLTMGDDVVMEVDVDRGERSNSKSKSKRGSSSRKDKDRDKKSGRKEKPKPGAAAAGVDTVVL